MNVIRKIIRRKVRTSTLRHKHHLDIWRKWHYILFSAYAPIGLRLSLDRCHQDLMYFTEHGSRPERNGDPHSPSLESPLSRRQDFFNVTAGDSLVALRDSRQAMVRLGDQCLRICMAIMRNDPGIPVKKRCPIAHQIMKARDRNCVLPHRVDFGPSNKRFLNSISDHKMRFENIAFIIEHARSLTEGIGDSLQSDASSLVEYAKGSKSWLNVETHYTKTCNFGQAPETELLPEDEKLLKIDWQATVDRIQTLLATCEKYTLYTNKMIQEWSETIP